MENTVRWHAGDVVIKAIRGPVSGGIDGRHGKTRSSRPEIDAAA